MTIPTMNEFCYPLLVAFSQPAVTNTRTALPHLKKHFGLTDEAMQELIPSGTRERVFDRADWAVFELIKAGLIERPKRGYHQLTEQGWAILNGPETVLDRKRLMQFPAYQAYISRPKKDEADAIQASPISAPESGETETPSDTMATAQATLDAAVRDDLLGILKDINPVRFERLILDLLVAMGYGGGDLANSHMTRAAGDGGIDGIIHEDKLGLDAVYIQAKRYAPDSKVGRPALQQFVGSLNGEGATKGVFVTTSDFSADARAFLDKVQHRIVLINGQELARLMIRYRVGVRVQQTYLVHAVDENYFPDPNSA